MERGGSGAAIGCLKRMNLPARSFGARLQNPVQIIRSMLRGRIWTYMAGTETILNGQQIHTFPPVYLGF